MHALTICVLYTGTDKHYTVHVLPLNFYKVSVVSSFVFSTEIQVNASPSSS